MDVNPVMLARVVPPRVFLATLLSLSDFPCAADKAFVVEVSDRELTTEGIELLTLSIVPFKSFPRPPLGKARFVPIANAVLAGIAVVAL